MRKGPEGSAIKKPFVASTSGPSTKVSEEEEEEEEGFISLEK